MPDAEVLDARVLRERREARLVDLLAGAGHALDDDEVERADDLLGQATVLAPDDERVEAGWARLDAARPRTAAALIDEARRCLGDDSPASAATLVARARALDPLVASGAEVERQVHAALEVAAQRARQLRRVRDVALAVGALVVVAVMTLPFGGDDELAALEARAEAALTAADPDAAVALFSEILAADPEHRAAQVGLARATVAADARRQARLDEFSARARAAAPAGDATDGRGAAADAAAAGADPETASGGGDVLVTGEETSPPPLLATSPFPMGGGAASGRRPPSRAGRESESPPDAPSTVDSRILTVRLCERDAVCGTLALQVSPAAEVAFNGASVGTARQGLLELPAGRHEITLETERHRFTRLLTIGAGARARLRVDLELDGVDRAPPAVVTAGAVDADTVSAADAGLDLGRSFLAGGDFEAAAEVLEAVTLILEGEPSRGRELQRARVLYGYAALYAYGEAAARVPLVAARAQDSSSMPARDEVPRRVFDLWSAAGDAGTLPDPPALTDATPAVVDLAVLDGITAEPAAWTSRDGPRLTLAVERARGAGSCAGEIVVDSGRGRVAWVPDGASSPCREADYPIDAVVSVAVAQEGGVVLRLMDPEPPLLFVPAPYRVWFAGGAGGRRYLDLPRESRVSMRLTVRALLEAMGRTPGSAWSHYGTPLDVTSAELLDRPAAYDGRAVRTRGRFARVGSDGAGYVLAAAGAEIRLAPTGDVRALVDANATPLDGSEISVTGLFQRQLGGDGDGNAAGAGYAIAFWDAASPVFETLRGAARPLDAWLAAGPSSGERVTVVGQYRGSNLFGDLPATSRPGGAIDAWVLRDDDASIWVGGARPEGAGWALELWSRRDTTTWLQVSGRLAETQGQRQLVADEVRPVPRPLARIPPSPGTLGWPADPPGVQFTLPLDFEAARPDSQLVVQFTKPMDPASFEGRVELAYASSETADVFSNVGLHYAQEQRSLHIDPGRVLEAGRTLELRLGADIADLAGFTLGAPRTITWRVEG